MTKHAKLYKRRQFIFMILAVSCVTVLALGVWSSAKRPQLEKALSIINETRLQIYETKIDGDELQIAFKNMYSKNINCFLIGIGDETIRTEFAYIDKVIAPGAIYRQSYSLEEGKADSIRVLAVMFDDGTEDGDVKSLTEIKDERLGVKMQLESILTQLNKALALPDAEMYLALDRMESQLLSPQDNQQSGLSENVKLGLHGGKAYLLRIIQELKNEHHTKGIRERLKGFKQRQEKIFSRL